MATRFKYSISRGQTHKDVTVGAGDTVGTDVISLNVDATNMTQGDLLKAIEELEIAITQGKWFPL